MLRAGTTSPFVVALPAVEMGVANVILISRFHSRPLSSASFTPLVFLHILPRLLESDSFTSLVFSQMLSRTPRCHQDAPSSVSLPSSLTRCYHSCNLSQWNNWLCVPGFEHPRLSKTPWNQRSASQSYISHALDVRPSSVGEISPAKALEGRRGLVVAFATSRFIAGSLQAIPLPEGPNQPTGP
jgi:hypothetical protein